MVFARPIGVSVTCLLSHESEAELVRERQLKVIWFAVTEAYMLTKHRVNFIVVFKAIIY